MATRPGKIDFITKKPGNNMIHPEMSTIVSTLTDSGNSFFFLLQLVDITEIVYWFDPVDSRN